MDPTSLSIAFTIWAAVVGLIGATIAWELISLRRDVKTLGARLEQLALNHEHRLTHVETHIETKDETFRAYQGPL